ncbi:MAG: hypothetical protein ACR2ME_11140 [Acidimicrobiia bacterium]
MPADGRGSLTGTGGYYLVVAVNADQALAVADAIRGGPVEIVRATGSTVIEVQP